MDYEEIYRKQILDSDSKVVQAINNIFKEPVSYEERLRSYESTFQDTPYHSEYMALLQSYKSQVNLIWDMYPHSEKKRAQALSQLQSSLDQSIQRLLQSSRENQQTSVASQVSEQREAGLNPDLLGVDTGAAAQGGTGIDTAPGDMALPEVTTGLEVAGTVLSCVGNFVGMGLNIANSVMSFGKLASDISLQQTSEDLINLQKTAYIHKFAEDFVNLTAPTFDEEIGAYPGWKPASIPGLPESFQEQALAHAQTYYGSEGHRAFQTGEQLSTQSSRDALAHLYGSGYYSDSMGQMSDSLAFYGRMHLDLIESDYKHQKAYNDLYAKYYKTLSPEAMAEAQNAVSTFTQEYYSELDGSEKASAENMFQRFQTEYLGSLDAQASADATDAQASFASAYYGSLDGMAKAKYENYCNELMKLQGEIQSTYFNAETALLNQFRSDLNSKDPSVRINAAQSIQKLKARMDRRSSQTGWQMFMDGLSTVTPIAIGLGYAGMKILGRGATAGMVVGPTASQNLSTSPVSSFYQTPML